MAQHGAKSVLEAAKDAWNQQGFWEPVELLLAIHHSAGATEKDAESGRLPLHSLMQATTLTEQALTVVLEKAPPHVWLTTDEVRAPCRRPVLIVSTRFFRVQASKTPLGVMPLLPEPQGRNSTARLVEIFGKPFRREAPVIPPAESSVLLLRLQSIFSISMRKLNFTTSCAELHDERIAENSNI